MSGQSFSLVTPPPPRRGTSRRSSLSPSTTASDVPWAGERHGGRKPLRSEFWGKCWEEKKGRVFEGRKEKSCEDQRQRRQERAKRSSAPSLLLHTNSRPPPRIPPSPPARPRQAPPPHLAILPKKRCALLPRVCPRAASPPAARRSPARPLPRGSAFRSSPPRSLRSPLLPLFRRPVSSPLAAGKLEEQQCELFAPFVWPLVPLRRRVSSESAFLRGVQA